MNLWTKLETAGTGNQTLNAKSKLESTVSISGLSVSNYFPQGGWTDDNGNHYQAFIKRNSDLSECNEVCVAKFNNQGTLIANTAVDLPLSHANDITYNSKEKSLVVCHGDGKTVVKLDAENLEAGVQGTFTLPVNIYSIAYNATRDCYVVGLSGGAGYQVLNSQFLAISEQYSTEEHTRIPCTYEGNCVKCDNGPCTANGYVTQGIDCDDSYVYFITHRNCGHSHELSPKNQIAVYDWSGNFVTWIALDNPNYEPENISVVGGRIYYTIWKQGGSRNEASVYRIDRLTY